MGMLHCHDWLPVGSGCSFSICIRGGELLSTNKNQGLWTRWGKSCISLGNGNLKIPVREGSILKWSSSNWPALQDWLKGDTHHRHQNPSFRQFLAPRFLSEVEARFWYMMNGISRSSRFDFGPIWSKIYTFSIDQSTSFWAVFQGLFICFQILVWNCHS